ncbi:MAG: S24 family peptidase, partial [Marinirhabdus sp.]
LVELLNGTKEITPLDTLHIPNISKADGAIYITGDGMYPLLKSGDIIIFKQITDVQNDIFWGHMYLVSIKTEDDGYLAVKYVHKSEKGAAFIRLVSENKHHDDKHVLLSKINALALIKASLRYHTMN